MASSFTTNKTLEKPGNGDYVDTWNVPVNADMDVIDQAFGGTTSINVTAVSGVTTLSASQYRSLIIAFSGTLTANVDYQLPLVPASALAVGGQWIVTNAATGAFTITVSSAGGGTSVVVAAGTRRLVYSDGTNIRSSFSVLQIEEGGTGAITAAGARTALGLGTSDNVTFQSVSDVSGNVRKVPENVQGGSYTLVLSDSGKYISTTSNVNVPDGIFSAGDTVTVFNSGTGTLTVSQGAGTTMYLAGIGTTGNRTLALKGLATILCLSSSTFVITGAGLS